MADNPKYLDSKLFSRLGRIGYRARRPMEGRLSGIHRSPHRGASIEFAEHKEYSPGDEIRHIDWKAAAKSDKYYIKQFEKESNLKVYFVVDSSASMSYGSTGRTKYETAGYLTAALSYLFLVQADSVGLIVHGEAQRTYVPPRAAFSHLYPLCTALEEAQPSGTVGISSGLEALSELGRRREVAFVISDLFDDSETVFRLLRRLRGRKLALTLFHVLDPDELTFPFGKTMRFEGMESAERVLAEPRLIRDAYLDEMGRFLDETKRRCLENDIGYQLIDSSSPIDVVVNRFLTGMGAG